MVGKSERGWNGPYVMGSLLVGVDLFSLFVEKKLGWPILFNYLMNVHLLNGLFFWSSQDEERKGMYLDIVVGEVQIEEINVVVHEMQGDYFF